VGYTISSLKENKIIKRELQIPEKDSTEEIGKRILADEVW
jgi:hypothetical protein